MTRPTIRHICENRDAHPSGTVAVYVSGPRPDPTVLASWVRVHEAHGFHRDGEGA